MIVDQNQLQRRTTLSISDMYEQQLMNECLMCIQQMIASEKNFAYVYVQ